MKFPDPINIGIRTSGIGTTGATGIALMILHTTGYLTGWAWPLLYVFLIISAIGQESRKEKNGNSRND